MNDDGPRDYRADDGAIDAVVIGAGTSGTFCGVSRGVRKQDPNVHFYASLWQTWKDRFTAAGPQGPKNA
jgi:cysteine synthase